MPDIGDILRELHVPWPEADENALFEAASIWRNLADAYRDGCGRANSAARSLTDNNEGAAIDAFERYWNKFGDSKGALPLAAGACDAMADACTKCANEVIALKRKIEARGEEALAVLGVGTVAAFFTFGATEAVADAGAAALVATAAGWIADSAAADWIVEFGLDLSTSLGTLSDTLADAVAESAGSLANAVGTGSYVGGVASALGTFGAGSAGGVASAALTAPLSEMTGQEPDSGLKLAKELFISGVTNGVGNVLGRLGELSTTQLANLLNNAALSVATEDPQLFTSLTTLSRQVEGVTGKLTNSTLASVASQLIVAQHVDAKSVVSDDLVDQLQRIAEGEDK